MVPLVQGSWYHFCEGSGGRLLAFFYTNPISGAISTLMIIAAG